MRALVLLVFCLPVFGATRVLDVMYDSGGNRTQATCTITWSAFTTETGRAIGGGKRDFRISNGVVDIRLEPTDGGTPATARYSVQCTPIGSREVQRETWNVPDSVSPVSLAAVRDNGAPGSGGGGSSSVVFVDSVTPTGTVNGSNVTFTLPSTPSPAGSLQVFRNGLLMKAGIDYTLSVATVTFFVASVPQTGDLLTASYRR